MTARATKSIIRKDGLADGIGICLAGLCLAHCFISTILLAFLATAGGAFFDPRVHEFGLLLAIIFGVLALGQGVRRHGFIMPAVIGALGLVIMAIALALPHGGLEIGLTMVGVGFLALAHYLNFRITR